MIGKENDPNIKFTKEHEDELNLYQSRLANFENNISIATQNLSVIKRDTVQAMKDAEYQTQQLDLLTNQVEQKKKELDSISRSVSVLEKTSKDLQNYQEMVTLELDTMKQDIERKENDLAQREHAFNESHRSLQVEKEKLTDEKTAFYRYYDEVKKVLNSFPWK